ncbi:hypothetical protein BO221_15735 [Archangium sp. Cb G35]|uniref:hypothetical protein n=1 Tax=Archangium sp. Cb G35 TaxID=1920190 RepID=UPI0009373B31|nr:hypothetical protein [Archangium sp. Cb G35]OJT24593.1 hypothetical protein BO221_15735 [Archangium sp. Cb G35]
MPEFPQAGTEASPQIPKGCTSSYAPEWIAASLALRRGEKTEARKAMEAGAKAKAAPVRKKSAGKKPAASKRAR